VTNIALAVGLGVMTLIVGLFTCAIESGNHERGRRLAELQREVEMIETANTQSAAVVSAHVWGRPNDEPDAEDPGGRD
jgi:hypothetical protein